MRYAGAILFYVYLQIFLGGCTSTHRLVLVYESEKAVTSGSEILVTSTKGDKNETD